MSGGSFHYAYSTVEDIATDIDSETIPEWERITRHALAELLRSTVEPLHDLEWWKSCDSNEGEFIRACDQSVVELEAALQLLRKGLSLVKECEAPGCDKGYLPEPVDGWCGCRSCNGIGYVLTATGAPLWERQVA